MVYCWQGAIWIFIDNERAIIRRSKMQRQAEGWQRMISAAVSHIYHWLNQPCTSQEAQVMEGFHCREHTGNASYCTANSQVYSCRNAFSKFFLKRANKSTGRCVNERTNLLWAKTQPQPKPKKSVKSLQANRVFTAAKCICLCVLFTAMKDKWRSWQSYKGRIAD